MKCALRPDEYLPAEKQLYDEFLAALGDADIARALEVQPRLAARIRQRGYTVYEYSAELLELRSQKQRKHRELKLLYRELLSRGIPPSAHLNSNNSAVFSAEEMELLRQRDELIQQSGLLQMEFATLREPLGIDELRIFDEQTKDQWPPAMYALQRSRLLSKQAGDKDAVQALDQELEDLYKEHMLQLQLPPERQELQDALVAFIIPLATQNDAEIAACRERLKQAYRNCESLDL